MNHAPIPGPARIAVRNDVSSGISPRDFRRILTAVATQLSLHVAPCWRILAPVVREITALSQRHPGEYVIHCVGKITNVPGAQGYHTEEDDGIVDGYVSTEGVDVNGFGVTLSHEAIEALLNPCVNLMVERRDGTKFDLEGSDAVEGQSYPITTTLGIAQVSDFILPEWLDELAPKGTRRDFLGILRGDDAFEIDTENNGYSGVETPDGQRGQLPPERRIAINKQHHMTRRARRSRSRKVA